ncbi:amino acid transporter [Plectosphaerella plurivora]|uniref:Amino acid transporter n=1 Tax=Plectosphaerella plurivora TaxID=936078 RepID=A0A9P8VLZ9_9PEZI|nr:amino acid transporter [Plectosphaerella plurivora]
MPYDSRYDDPRYDGTTNMNNSHRTDYALNGEPEGLEAQRYPVSPHTLAPQDSTAKPPMDGIMNQGYESESTLPTDGRHSYQTNEKRRSETEGQVGNLFDQGGKNYRTVGRWMSGIILITNQVGIGILSLPAALQTLGLVPGIIAIIGLGLLSTYTAYVLLQFYRKHPHVVNVPDMARIVGGPILEAIVGIGLFINLIFTGASISVTVSVALNSMSEHALCTAGFSGIACIAFWLLCLPRKFSFVAKVGIPSTISILASVLIVMISLGVSGPSNAEEANPNIDIVIVGSPSFRDGLTTCLNICYAYAGNAGFVSYMAEMQNPSKDFVPALIILQGFSIPLYVVVAIVIYTLSGQYTRSPSLGSAPILPAKIAYGIVLPCLLATGMVFGHTAIKYLYVVIMKKIHATDEITSRTRKSWGVWIGCATFYWVGSFIMANAIPVFDSILSISSSTLIAWFTFGISGVFWFHLNWHRLFANWKKIALTIVNALIILQALFMNTAGTWAAIVGLVDIFNDPEYAIERPFTCADNSIF